MPLFVFIGHDGPKGADRRNANRERHVARLEDLHRSGRLVYGGPIRNQDNRSVGAVLVLEVPDLDAARALVAEDPYVVGGVFDRIEVSRFVQAFPH